MTSGPIPSLPAVSAPADMLAEARANCAARYRARGAHAEADAFLRGDRDDRGWAMRHEINRLRSEQAARGGVLVLTETADGVQAQ